MNNKSIKIALFAIMLAGMSCKKVLDVQPASSISDQSIYVSAQKIESAMNGVYDAAQSGFYAGGAVRGYPFGAASIEQGDMRGEDMLNQALFYQITYEAAYNSTSANQEFMFNTLYSLINKANLFIEGVTASKANNILTEAKTNQYLGEARFLRAMAHHELLINFARPYADGNGAKMGIVYRETGINTPDKVPNAKELKRATVAENYTKILADLDFAETNLPAISTNDAGADVKTFRASKAAAIALKMRVKLHKQDWAGIIAEGAKLVPATSVGASLIKPWALEAAPATPFANATSNENIFSIRNASTDNGGVNGALANMLGNEGIGGRGLVRVSPVVYNLAAWKCDDKRRDLLVRYPLNASGNATSATNYSITKYKDPVTSTDPAPIIRYAEVLLILAEAEARNSVAVSTRALELLNAVRNRSLADVTTQQYTVASFLAKNDLIKAILSERRIEFLAEGKRWGDIHRLAVDPDFSTGGIPAKIGSGGATFSMYSCGAGNAAYTTAIASIPYSDYRFIWPIPLSETQQNPNFEQNPSY